MRSLLCAVVALLLLALYPTLAHARWAMVGDDVPLDRLLTNTTRYVKDHPDDAQGYYVLARLHSLAYARGQDKTARVVGKEDLPTFPHYESVRVTPEKEKLDDASRAHLMASLANYAQATKLAPDKPLYWMGRGWMVSQAAADANFLLIPSQIPPTPTTLPATLPAVPAATYPNIATLRRSWENLALTCYQKVIDLAMTDDLKLGHIGPDADAGLSEEAIGYAITILKTRLPDPAVQTRITTLQEQLKKFSGMGRAETPIIFSLTPSHSVADLLAPNSATTFNLAGDDRPALWPWLKADTCILVWDPQHTGRITSGRQLFGSATFWMFFENGYQALAALDDNADGYLSGHELDGLAVWRDANGNGIADPGEVVPVDQLGIVKIAGRPSHNSDGTFENAHGLTLQDGRTLPTYDWTPHSITPRR